MEFYQGPGDKKNEFGALVSGSEMSKFGSWNVTKYCAQGRDLPNKNEIYALVSWWDMSNFVGSWNLTKHCVNCFLALVSVGKISFPALVSGGWSRFDVKMSPKKLTQGQNIQKEIPAVSLYYRIFIITKMGKKRGKKREKVNKKFKKALNCQTVKTLSKFELNI